jgi:hypothetical protein
LATPDLEVQQDAADGVTVAFPAERLPEVAEVLRLRRRRRLSPEARAKLAALGTATRFHKTHGVGARENAPNARGRGGPILWPSDVGQALDRIPISPQIGEI